ncbi:MAG: pyruvate formate lyase-activating protein, partial [Clostridia bacterium]|nr:pyruvate formate lyase-activating protein [Clostridia bacterium]
IQTMGTLDGPGVRFVVFMQGCHLRCKCCHNPDTWALEGGTAYTPEELAKRVIRYREYFGTEGGITVSGGEPLLQAGFVHELFLLCHQEGINTCLDTSGGILNRESELLLTETDRVLLDIKYTEDSLYKEHVGCSLNEPIAFLKYVNEQSIPTTLRQVIIPGLTDSEENVNQLVRIAELHTCVDKIELLPFKKICQAKYDNMKLSFPFAHIPTPSAETMVRLTALLSEYASGIRSETDGY